METDDLVETGIGSNSKLSGSISADDGDSVLEEVVEEGQILMQTVNDHQVVVVTEGSMGHQHIVITEGNLANGTQVIQLQDGNLVMDSAALKVEPEDLSVRDEDDEQAVVRLPGNRQINLEQGAQAIQDSINHVVVEESLHDSMQQSPAKRTRTAPNTAANASGQNEIHPKVCIAKQYSPFGFHTTLEAPTAQWVRRDEDRCTYLNKGQFYGITLEYRANPAEPMGDDSSLVNVKSVVMLVFRDAKLPEDETNAWEFWHGRQPSPNQRIIDAETNSINDQCGIVEIEDVAYNAIAVYWNPLEKPAFLSVAIQCLSTDFSLQKGVKGLPMHLQVDTYAKNTSDGQYDIIHRTYCQVKVFCDKGAERKFRQEERRAAKKVAVGGQRVLEMYHQCQDRSEFYSMVDLSRVPVLFVPSPSASSPLHNIISGGALGPATLLSPSSPTAAATTTTNNNSGSGGAGLSLLKNNCVMSEQALRRRKAFPPPETRMVVYVRQENEEIYTPLHLVPPTVPGLARAIETKYNVSATAIRYLYRRNSKGIVAKLDDDLLKFYCNEDTFLMQVTAIELEGVAGQESIMYDITLCELNE